MRTFAPGRRPLVHLSARVGVAHFCIACLGIACLLIASSASAKHRNSKEIGVFLGFSYMNADLIDSRQNRACAAAAGHRVY